MRIKAKNNSELWNKLEQLLLEWRRMNSSSDNDSAQMSLNLEITETFFALFPIRVYGRRSENSGCLILINMIRKKAISRAIF